ncbi:hypothetical protein FGG08_003367 [Glutinoglossum americanum]|uniref:Helicase ATP-binding domain-containing protein n=1 Tax=Glutinoglossum americanum TaxID=1670608 RepID=A0A9P8IB82_9PEZI|nr:hypothetical protein FGG08_003367 [Glutinoglossum americanum]
MLRHTTARSTKPTATQLRDISTDHEGAGDYISLHITDPRAIDSDQRPKTTAPAKKAALKPPPYRVSAMSPSSISSFGTASAGDLSSRYTTPGTSVSVTPRDTAARRLASHRVSRSHSRIGGIERLGQPSDTKPASRRNMKRKRDLSDEVSDSDAAVGIIEDLDSQVARALQMEEDEEGIYVFVAHKGKKRAISTEDIMEVDSVNDDNDDDDDEDDEYQDDEEDEDYDDADYVNRPKATVRVPAKNSRNRHSATRVSSYRLSRPSIPEHLSDSELSDISVSSLDSAAEGSDIHGSGDQPTGAIQPHSTPMAGPPTLPLDTTPRMRLRGRRLRAHIRGFSSRADRDRQNLERQHPELTTMWDTLRETPVIQPEKSPQPKEISRSLKPFQLEGLNWMIKQEKTPFKGGLLGDEMGMGKTIQAVSLIMSDYPAKHPTLVLVPPVALMQWQNEIRDYTNGKLKVLVYHGYKKDKLSRADLKRHDIVLVTYAGIEYTYRKEQKGVRRKVDSEELEEELVKANSVIHSVKWHRVVLDEAHSIKANDMAD